MTLRLAEATIDSKTGWQNLKLELNGEDVTSYMTLDKSSGLSMPKFPLELNVN